MNADTFEFRVSIQRQISFKMAATRLYQKTLYIKQTLEAQGVIQNVLVIAR